MTGLLTMLKSQLRAARKSTFFMNAMYLMLSTFVVAGLGFVFWIVIARGYSSATVGLAGTLLSVSGLLSMLSLAGFDTTFIRFLPKSTRRNDHINSGIILVALLSGVLSIGFVVSLPLTSPSLAFVLHDPWYFAGFTFFTVATSLNILTNAIFLAQKRARDIFIINVLFSVFKVALPFFILEGNVMTIFAIVGASQLLGLALSLIVMRARCGYVFSPKVHLDILRVTRKYSFSVYASSILNLLPPTVLPLIVVHQLGPEDAAYYYIVFTIASALYTIAYASTQSALAEGSHDEAALRMHMLKAARLIGALLVPAAVLIFAFSGFILRFFGTEYAAGGSALLRLFSVSALTVALCSAMGAMFKVMHNLRGVVVMNVVYAGVILGLSYVFIPHFGIIAVGWAWVVGTIAATAIGLVFLKRSNMNYRLGEG
jgi:O-antigen/teichoic acid export membrane protein